MNTSGAYKRPKFVNYEEGFETKPFKECATPKGNLLQSKRGSEYLVSKSNLVIGRAATS